MIFLGSVFFVQAEDKEVKILFTHDIHSYLDAKEGIVDGAKREFGGIARLATALKNEETENSVYVDAGDIAMGTLYQAGFSSDAYELRLLGKLGCSYVTLGNHEFDYGCDGLADELKAALKAGGSLPKLVESSFDFSGELTTEEANLKEALRQYGMQEYFIEEINGVSVGFFGLEGPDSIECVQANVRFRDYIEVAEEMVNTLREKCDLVVCLSHVGTDGDGKTGEDFDMLSKVKGIDIVVSGHSHTAYKEPVKVGNTILVSAGCYLQYLGSLTVSVGENGASVKDYKLIPIDNTLKEDEEVASFVKSFKQRIKETYLVEYADGGDYDDVLTHSDFDFISLDEMYATHDEYPMGDLIADSYLYEAKKHGITDIDVALVGLGTVRGSFLEGDIKLADAFEICSLGVGSDGSAGHPLLTAYITGSELKLLCELDASLGPMVSSIKMSYAGLHYTFNTARMILDRVSEIYLVRENGVKEIIQDEKLYKVCCNMYAANMLGMLNGLTKGILKIVPKNADGSTVEDFYSVAMLTEQGKEIKEWVALRDYLASFEDGKLPIVYADKQDRKVKTNEHGIAVLKNPGLMTWIACILGWVIIVVIVLVTTKTVKKIKRKKAGIEEPAKKTKKHVRRRDRKKNKENENADTSKEDVTNE